MLCIIMCKPWLFLILLTLINTGLFACNELFFNEKMDFISYAELTKMDGDVMDNLRKLAATIRDHSKPQQEALKMVLREKFHQELSDMKGDFESLLARVKLVDMSEIKASQDGLEIIFNQLRNMEAKYAQKSAEPFAANKIIESFGLSEESKGSSSAVSEIHQQAYAEAKRMWETHKKNMIMTRESAIDAPMKDMLEIIDNLERSLKEGFQKSEHSVVRSIGLDVESFTKTLLERLKPYGVTKLEVAPRDMFNPDIHEAVAQVPVPGFDKNMIIEVMSTGYIKNDRVFRFPKVVVAL